MMNQYPLIPQLKTAKDYNEVFTLVKKSVESSLSLHRAGLTLILAEIPNHIGAYHVAGSNIIVINRTILHAMKTLSQSKVEFNSFIFSILTHEYLHTFGYHEETHVHKLVSQICEQNFGPEHPTMRFATKELFALYPQLQSLGPGKTDNSTFEIINNFDRSSMSYIG